MLLHRHFSTHLFNKSVEEWSRFCASTKHKKYGLKKPQETKTRFQDPNTTHVQPSLESQQMESQHIIGEREDAVTQNAECGNLKIDLALSE